VHKVPKFIRSTLGFALVIVGVLFIILPGPAVLFLPLGLALLSVDYPKAKVWLKRCQRMMSKSAQQLDRWLLARKHR